MVTLLIQSEMGLDSFDIAEDVKKYPLAKVESFFHIRHENGTVEFFTEPLKPSIFAKTVILKEGEMIPLEGDWSMEKIRLIRRQAKQKVFVTNALRALARVSPTGNVRDIQFVVLVGGSALILKCLRWLPMHCPNIRLWQAAEISGELKVRAMQWLQG